MPVNCCGGPREKSPSLRAKRRSSSDRALCHHINVVSQRWHDTFVSPFRTSTYIQSSHDFVRTFGHFRGPTSKSSCLSYYKIVLENTRTGGYSFPPNLLRLIWHSSVHRLCQHCITRVNPMDQLRTTLSGSVVDKTVPALPPEGYTPSKELYQPRYRLLTRPFLPHSPPEALPWYRLSVLTTPTSASRITPSGKQYLTLEWVKMGLIP